LRLGLDPGQRSAFGNIIGGSFLESRIEQRAELIGLAAPIMNYFYSLVKGVGGVVVLADRQGVIIHSIGDAEFMSKAERVLLKPGASWAERHRGTNAIGTALEDGVPIAINGHEHFMRPNFFLSCSAVPVFDSIGNVAGVLNVSTDSRKYHPYISSLISVAAHSLEKQLFFSRAASYFVTASIHPSPGGLGSISEGVLGLSEDGKIVAANLTALKYLGISHLELGSEKLQQIVDIKLEDILRYGRFRPEGYCTLRMYRGKEMAFQFALTGDKSTIFFDPKREAPLAEQFVQVPSIKKAEHTLKAISREIALDALEAAKGNITKAARSLGISRNTLYKYMRQESSK
jgi:transcriptional regulator of acetoin/glycerol metabolism